MKPSEDQVLKNESYASKVFQESSVGMVSSLSQTNSLRRKAFKLLALFLCLFGFLYQSGSFLSVVFQYPTTVDVNILRPTELQVPGFTFCDNSGINRRLFCEKFPDNCEEPTEKFCHKFEYYCGENKTLVPKKEFYKLNIEMTLEEMVQLNVKPEDFVQITEKPNEENITGPHMRKRDLGDPTFICYSLYGRVNNSLLPLTTQKDPLWREPVSKFTFNIRSDEMFLPGNRAGVLFSIHSPYKAVNPFEEGIFLKPGRSYMIFVSMQEEVLLQKPYKTDCLNYTELWEKRGYIGPRKQEMCFQECITDISLKCFNCVVPMILYPSVERLCRPEEINVSGCPADYESQFDACEFKCKNDCHYTKYTYKVQERFSANLLKDINSENDIFTKIAVEIFLEGDEIFVLQHSPKYMVVEVFSNIGGFIGCWLGISLLDITDIFEGFFRIIRYSFKKKLPLKDIKIAL